MHRKAAHLTWALTLTLLAQTLLTVTLLTDAAFGQSPQPYPHATTDQDIHPKTAIAPPAVNVRFNDPDFGTQMVRVTDEHSAAHGSEVTFQASAAGKDEWSRDGRKFYVNAGGGGLIAFGFYPSSMAIQPLAGAKTGTGIIASAAYRCHVQPGRFGPALWDDE